MLMLNPPDKKPTVKKKPYMLEGFTFNYKGKTLKLFQFAYHQYVSVIPGDYNRWSDRVINYDTYEADLDNHFPGWSEV